MIIDFGHSQRRVPSWYPWFTPGEVQLYLPGVYISPLPRWNERDGRVACFRDWINWDWDSWLDRTYESTKASIADDMRKLWGQLR